jgi:zinc and cadmium transporter
MQSSSLLLLGLLAAAANVGGALLLLPSTLWRQSESTLKFFVAIGAGVLLAVNFIEILPRSLALWNEAKNNVPFEETVLPPLLLTLAGYLFVHLFEQTLTPHVHLGEHQKTLIAPSTAYTAVGGVLFHSFFDGIAIAAAAAINVSAGVLVFLAIALHKIPEGFTVASLVVAAGKSFRHACAASVIVGLSTLLGVLIFVLFQLQTTAAIAFLLPLAAGVALYIAASELIPELHHHGRDWRFSLFVFVGVAAFFALHYFLHRLLETN